MKRLLTPARAAFTRAAFSLAAFSLATLILAGLAAGPAGAADGSETVTIQDYPGTGNLLYRVAIAEGYCEKHGIDCDLQMVQSGPLGVQALLAGSIDAALAPTEVAVMAVLKGAKIRGIISGVRNNVFQIVARNDLAMPNADKGYPDFMADLKGKKIGVPARGSGAELQFALLARDAGMSPRDFTFVAVGGPNTSYGALMSGQIDASMTFGTSAPMCDVLKTCRTVYLGSTATKPAAIAGTNGASGLLVVRQAMIDEKPQVVAAMIAAAEDAQAFIQDPANFERVVEITKAYFKADIPDGEAVIRETLRRAIPSYAAPISRDALRQIAANMLATKLIEAPFDTATLVHPEAP